MEGGRDFLIVFIDTRYGQAVSWRGMEFEWDARKAAENLAKHGVDFVWAIRIFSDSHRLERESDPDRYGEVRRVVIGLIDEEVYAVVYTPRGEVHRIISARKASRHERRSYYTRQNAS